MAIMTALSCGIIGWANCKYKQKIEPGVGMIILGVLETVTWITIIGMIMIGGK